MFVLCFCLFCCFFVCYSSFFVCLFVCCFFFLFFFFVISTSYVSILSCNSPMAADAPSIGESGEAKMAASGFPATASASIYKTSVLAYRHLQGLHACMYTRTHTCTKDACTNACTHSCMHVVSCKHTGPSHAASIRTLTHTQAEA